MGEVMYTVGRLRARPKNYFKGDAYYGTYTAANDRSTGMEQNNPV